MRTENRCQSVFTSSARSTHTPNQRLPVASRNGAPSTCAAHVTVTSVCYCMTLSVAGLHSVQCYNDWRVINRKGSGRKRPWTIPTFASRDRGKPTKIGQDGQCSSRQSKRAPPEDESRHLPLGQPARSYEFRDYDAKVRDAPELLPYRHICKHLKIMLKEELYPWNNRSVLCGNTVVQSVWLAPPPAGAMNTGPSSCATRRTYRRTTLRQPATSRIMRFRT
jgi:hypothetical protein